MLGMGNEKKKSALSLVEILKSVAEGMRATVHQALRPEVTDLYPDERPHLPWGTRSQLYCEIEECIGCFKCAKVCPVDCIRIDAVRVEPGTLTDTSDEHKRMFEVVRFDIDMGQCCYCGLCTGRSSYVPDGLADDDDALAYAEKTAACPSDCLNFHPRFENGTHDAGNFVYHFARFDLEEATKRWSAAEVKKRRSTHEKVAHIDYLTVASDKENDAMSKGFPDD